MEDTEQNISDIVIYDAPRKCVNCLSQSSQAQHISFSDGADLNLPF